MRHGLRNGGIVALLIFLFLPWPAFAFVPRAGENVTFSQTIQDDLYIAGGTVTVTGTVDGDVTAAGGTGTVISRVGGALLGAGGTGGNGGSVGRSLRAAGGAGGRRGAARDAGGGRRGAAWDARDRRAADQVSVVVAPGGMAGAAGIWAGRLRPPAAHPGRCAERNPGAVRCQSVDWIRHPGSGAGGGDRAADLHCRHPTGSGSGTAVAPDMLFRPARCRDLAWRASAEGGARRECAVSLQDPGRGGDNPGDPARRPIPRMVGPAAGGPDGTRRDLAGRVALDEIAGAPGRSLDRPVRAGARWRFAR